MAEEVIEIIKRRLWTEGGYLITIIVTGNYGLIPYSIITIITLWWFLLKPYTLNSMIGVTLVVNCLTTILTLETSRKCVLYAIVDSRVWCIGVKCRTAPKGRLNISRTDFSAGSKIPTPFRRGCPKLRVANLALHRTRANGTGLVLNNIGPDIRSANYFAQLALMPSPGPWYNEFNEPRNTSFIIISLDRTSPALVGGRTIEPWLNKEDWERGGRGNFIARYVNWDYTQDWCQRNIWK